MKTLFIGDIVGEPGLAYLEQHLTDFVTREQVDVVIVNAENMDITRHSPSMGNCGMTEASLKRLLELPIDMITGGNHSWDGPDWQRVHEHPKVLRPLNYGTHAPGRGWGVIDNANMAVVNVVSRGALPLADDPIGTLEACGDLWQGGFEAIIIDMHGESVTEKQMVGFAFDGQVTAVLGTHTHVATLDTRVLPKGTAYVSDVGMTGPSGGLQGYNPQVMVDSRRLRLPVEGKLMLATGELELGAVLITHDAGQASSIGRILSFAE
ncbi:MAG: YmdB family metallophosphoesterase [Deinococcota bacterium]